MTDDHDTRTLKILQRYSAGEISARQAAKEMGPKATEHDVFAGIVAANLPLPSPSPDDVAREVAALRALYGPHGPLPRQADPWLEAMLRDVYDRFTAIDKACGDRDFSPEEEARYWALVSEFCEIDDAMREARKP